MHITSPTRSAPLFPVQRWALAWVAGTAVQLQQPALWALQAYRSMAGAVLAIWLLGMWWRLTQREALRHAGVLWVWRVLLVAALAFAVTGWRAAVRQADGLPAALQGVSLQVQGRVVGLPQWRADGSRFVLAVDAAYLPTPSGAQPVALPPRVQLAWYVPRKSRAASVGDVAGVASADGAADAADTANAPPAPISRATDACPVCVRAGEVWQFTVRLKQPHGHRNPLGFDYELWLWEHGIGATGYVRTGSGDAPARRVQDATPPPWWQRMADAVDRARLHVRASIAHTLAPADVPAQQRVAGVVAALVMGDQGAIERDDWDIFRATGVAHLMSISGLHITMLAWLLAALVAGLWRLSARLRWPLCLWLPAPAAGLLAGVLCAAAYAWFSGWGVPAQRTVYMLLVATALRLAGRRWPWHVTWLVAAAVVLAWDPWSWLQAGFWLSFVAVGVLFLSDQHSASAPVPQALWQRMLRPIGRLLREQTVVVLALTPLTLLWFGQVSLVGFLANMLAVPWVTLLVVPVALLGLLWPALWQVAGACTDGLMQVLQVLAAWPYATYHAALPPWWAGLAGVLAGMALAMPRWPASWRMAGLAAMLPVLLWQSPRPPVGEFELLAADIGQGSAIVVRTAHHTLLFDAGPRYGADSNAARRVLLPLLRAWNERVDLLVLSHEDSDHIGGAQDLLSAYPHARATGAIPPAHALHTLRTIHPCHAGEGWQWDGVQFRILHPLPADQAAPGKSNATSCVLRIDNARRSAMLTGDIGSAQERAIIARTPPAALRSDVLVVAHHGSNTSTSAAWLRAVQAQWALIQHGYRNSYRHPHPAVIARLQQQGTRIVTSDACGAARWQSATHTVQCERHTHRRYWQHNPPALGEVGM